MLRFVTTAARCSRGLKRILDDKDGDMSFSHFASHVGHHSPGAAVGIIVGAMWFVPKDSFCTFSAIPCLNTFGAELSKELLRSSDRTMLELRGVLMFGAAGYLLNVIGLSVLSLIPTNNVADLHPLG